MEKYWLRASQGLGKQRQGIKQALVMEQTFRLKDRIVNLGEVEEKAEKPSFVWEEEGEVLLVM